MHESMGSMMGWMMGVGLVGWVLVIALLVTIVVLLMRLVNRQPRRNDLLPPHRDDASRRSG